MVYQRVTVCLISLIQRRSCPLTCHSRNPSVTGYGSRQDLRASKNLQVLNGDAHANRRRLWNRGLSSESIESYSDIIETRAAQLIDCLERQPGKICLSSFFSRFAFVHHPYFALSYTHRRSSIQIRFPWRYGVSTPPVSCYDHPLTLLTIDLGVDSSSCVTGILKTWME